MDTNRIQQATEDAIVKMIREGNTLKMDYDRRIDVSSEMRKVHSQVNWEKVFVRVKELLEEEIAQKMVNKIVTEMGTDIKTLMSNATVRDDFKFLMRKGVNDILQKIKQ